MSNSVLDSYLVSLNFAPDQPSFAKFQGVLKMAEGSVATVAGKISADMLAAQFAVTGAFASMGLGVIGYIDKLSMGDQQMRLFAQRSFMTLNQARAVKNSLDLLGVSLEDVAWDKELGERFRTLKAQQDQFTSMLGPGYEDQLKMVRDVRFELTKLEASGQAFGALFTRDLLAKLGFGDGKLTEQLEKLNDYVMKNLPKWSDELSTDVLPILKDFGNIMKGLGVLAKDAALEFTNLVGVFSGDSSIQGATFDFHKFAAAVEKVAHWAAVAVEKLIAVERIAIHLAPVIAGVVGGAAVGGGIGATAGATAGAVGGPLGMLAGGLAGGAGGSLTGGIIGGLGGMVAMGFEERARQDAGVAASTPSATGMSANSAILRAIRHVAEGTRVHEDLIYAQAAFETGGFSSNLARNYNNLSGIKIPGTQTFQHFASVEDWANAQIKVLSNPRYLNNGLRDAVTGEDMARALNTPGYTYYGTDDRRNYGMGVESRRREYDDGVSVGTINVHITQPNAHGPEIQAAVTKGVRDALGQRTQNDMIQTAGIFP